jgi:deoxyribonuclease V
MYIAALDVDYRDSGAIAARVWFRDWDSPAAEFEEAMAFESVAEYASGEFYRRELPCLLGILAGGPQTRLIVVDGYTWLDDERSGLGAHLFKSLGGSTPVVGVAKTHFVSAKGAIPICRGKSASPLYVTAAGVDPAPAAAWISSMHGDFRIPTLLKRADHLARSAS